MNKISLKRRVRVGYIVFGALIGSKAVEYLVATTVHRGAWPYLAILAFIGAGLIFYYFMHVRQLWRQESRDDK